MNAILKKAKDSGAVQITAIIISGGGLLIMAGYGALFSQFDGQVKRNTTDIAAIQPDVSATKATMNAIDARLVRIENKLDRLSQ
jgi:hypothetical protein